MKNLLVLLAFAGVFTGSVEAFAENPQGVHLIKGSKSYQNIDRRSAGDDNSEAHDANTMTPEEANQIIPSAGAEKTDQDNERQDKPLHELMRLPRKNF